jgi:phosphoribosylformylglycinamidine cyclo-ligase
VQAAVDRNSWEIPPLMRLFQDKGAISDDEMLRVFNCGIGLAAVVPASQADAVCEYAQHHDDSARVIGTIEKRGEAPIAFA